MARPIRQVAHIDDTGNICCGVIQPFISVPKSVPAPGRRRHCYDPVDRTFDQHIQRHRLPHRQNRLTDLSSEIDFSCV